MGMTSRESGMMREASKLDVPRASVVSQQYGPFFDKYPLTGKTYTTASGAVIPNELQYYNGEMAHLYGECANVSAVAEVLAGSGYKAMTLKYADGRQTAIAQLWSSRFTDTSIGPYSAMFIVVVVVRDDAPSDQASIRADPNGASSVLAMLDGLFDPATATYENRVRLFLVRLLDTTQVAIDVGRERMGTDKRFGIIDMTRSGCRLRLSISDQGKRGVVKADVELTDNPAAFVPEVAKAAATAGIPFRPLPRGTEYVYPASARIGRGPVVSWQWRSDLIPQLQPVVPGTVVFDPSSEEGRMLLAWGFTPKVLGYIPNVRGVITGLADQMPQQLRGGSNVSLLRAALPGDPSGTIGQLPVLRFIAQSLSSGQTTPLKARADEGHPATASPNTEQPRWAWETTFLGSFRGILRKEVVGVTPDGFRINWHVTEGSFVGAGLEAVILPGAADWTVIRKDGVGIVNVKACFETRTGVRIYATYGGLFDLGRDGYARALRDEFDQFPPVVVTPTYQTSDRQLEWLNRAQCIGVGRVDMSTLQVEFDVYVVRVGARTSHASLYSRLGGQDVIVAVTEDFVTWALADRQLGRFFPNVHPGPALQALKERIVDFLCKIADGPCVYKGRDMKTAHAGLGITDADWKIAIDLFTKALDKSHVAPREQSEFLQLIEEMKNQIVEIPARPTTQ